MEIIINAIKAQLASPARAGINSEAAFVRERIERQAGELMARRYWSWAISAAVWRAANPVFGKLAVTLQLELDAIDDSTSLPSWATYGT